MRATRTANDYADMSRDAEAAVAWLAGQGVPEDSIGLIGAEVGGSIAIRFAAVHTKVPLVVMLSPLVSPVSPPPPVTGSKSATDKMVCVFSKRATTTISSFRFEW